jgi:hypothetical protein
MVFMPTVTSARVIKKSCMHAARCIRGHTNYRQLQLFAIKMKADQNLLFFLNSGAKFLLRTLQLAPCTLAEQRSAYSTFSKAKSV